MRNRRGRFNTQPQKMRLRRWDVMKALPSFVFAYAIMAWSCLVEVPALAGTPMPTAVFNFDLYDTSLQGQVYGPNPA